METPTLGLGLCPACPVYVVLLRILNPNQALRDSLDKSDRHSLSLSPNVAETHTFRGGLCSPSALPEPTLNELFDADIRTTQLRARIRPKGGREADSVKAHRRARTLLMDLSATPSWMWCVQSGSHSATCAPGLGLGSGSGLGLGLGLGLKIRKRTTYSSQG